MAKSLFRYPVVVCVWKDAHARPPAVEYAESEIEQQHKAEVVITLGLCIREDDKGITLYNEECGPDSVRTVSFIPREMIVSVERFKLTRIRPKKDAVPTNLT